MVSARLAAHINCGSCLSCVHAGESLAVRRATSSWHGVLYNGVGDILVGAHCDYFSGSAGMDSYYNSTYYIHGATARACYPEKKHIIFLRPNNRYSQPAAAEAKEPKAAAEY